MRTYPVVIWFLSVVCLCWSGLAAAEDPGLAGNGSNLNDPAGGRLEPSQTKVLLGQGTTDMPATGDEEGLNKYDVDAMLPAKDRQWKYIGIWNRQGTYAGGQLVSSEPATIQFLPDQFFSTGTCSVTGSVEVQGDVITLTTQSTDCFNHKVGTKTVSAMKFSEDAEKMELINTQYGGPVVEVFIRN